MTAALLMANCASDGSDLTAPALRIRRVWRAAGIDHDAPRREPILIPASRVARFVRT